MRLVNVKNVGNYCFSLRGVLLIVRSHQPLREVSGERLKMPYLAPIHLPSRAAKVVGSDVYGSPPPTEYANEHLPPLAH